MASAHGRFNIDFLVWSSVRETRRAEPVFLDKLTMAAAYETETVQSLLQNQFERRPLAEKLKIKETGPDQPKINIRQQVKDKEASYTRGFWRTWYTRKPWLTGCGVANALFCFPCLLFKTSMIDRAWYENGVQDMKHFSEKIKQVQQQFLCSSSRTQRSWGYFSAVQGELRHSDFSS